jgi:hypothetical protein
VAYLAASAFWTQQDPFVGKWTLDVSRSTIVDRMEVRSVGPNRYAFNFEGAPTETVLADGTDQPGLPGTTLSVRSEDARSLKVVRKQDGHVIVSADWKLARDGRTLRDDFANAQPDGSTVVIHYLYRRAPGTAGASGFAGAWESTTKPLGVKLELAIAPYAGQGLTFTSPGSVKSVTFDGRDHALPGASEGQTAAGHRRGPRTLDYTEGDHGKVQHTRQFALSPDGRTLTETLRTPGEKTPNVLVFARE